MDALGAMINVASVVDWSAKGANVVFHYVQDVAKADTNLQHAKDRLTQEVKAFDSFRALGGCLKDRHPQCDDAGQPHKKLLQSIYEMQSEDFSSDLESFIRWLDLQRGKPSDGDEMSLSQRLKWPLYGKRKVRKFILKLAEKKDNLTLVLLLIIT